ncbi:unnamed protein product [Albugo candida]|uniref:Uncharacterized protein n=1 Tax=Albugo candida TaxID=65357 RepID=A0A024FXE0_9STRA|nr:unnamed protein product [Albugo candida]|eukprot:CCI11691.1 unnamed protein product [Albugo candida]
MGKHQVVGLQRRQYLKVGEEDANNDKVGLLALLVQRESSQQLYLLPEILALVLVWSATRKVVSALPLCHLCDKLQAGVYNALRTSELQELERLSFYRDCPMTYVITCTFFL